MLHFDEEDLLSPDLSQIEPPPEYRIRRIVDLLQSPEAALTEAKSLLKEYPKDVELLLLTCYCCLLLKRPDPALAYCKRLTKHFLSALDSDLLNAIALAQKGLWYQSHHMIEGYMPRETWRLRRSLPPWIDLDWVRSWIRTISNEMEARRVRSHPPVTKQRAGRRGAAPLSGIAGDPSRKTEARTPKHQANAALLDDLGARLPALPSISATIRTTFKAPTPNSIPMPDSTHCDIDWVRLRMELASLSLYQGFDELLCLPHLHDVDNYWYQVEAVRKVLKLFRGRVLLADEVGLGKTVEAGMIMKEYMLRGMAQKILILTPASIVGQWRQEMASKFRVEFASTYDRRLRVDPQSFWDQPRVIASMAVARGAEHFEILRRQVYDLIIVDEAHHLKNRATRNWKLVDALQKRFLLLLSATPVQNSLVELYNLLTLLKPGIFKTEKEFRDHYMTPGKPRIPANRDRLSDLMRDVMIRNTHSQVDVRLPPRTALTMRLDPWPEEQDCYEQLSALIKERYENELPAGRLALRHLLASAGSSPAAALAGLGRYLRSHLTDDRWGALHRRYSQAERGSKDSALLELIARNEQEKKIVFVHHLATLEHLERLLNSTGRRFEVFHGSMRRQEKDSAVLRFRQEVPLLLATESGGEGRNLQFANTLINFDLPWNPMAIEQRIGRLHRIGQERPVFIFNLAVKHTLEEYLLGVLDEKINMFELVVGEIGAILGEMDEERDFADLVFRTWVDTSAQDRADAFDQLGEIISGARQEYDQMKTLDQKLFGDDFVAV